MWISLREFPESQNFGLRTGVIRPAFYGIYEVQKASVEVYHYIENRFEPISSNERGHFPIPPMGVEWVIWQGQYQNLELSWLGW
jgi:Uma2 family endonuclease